MTTPDADPADRTEQLMTQAGDAAVAPDRDVPLEASEADVLEQTRETAPTERRAARDLPLEADEPDAAEQTVVIEQDAEEYR